MKFIVKYLISSVTILFISLSISFLYDNYNKHKNICVSFKKAYTSDAIMVYEKISHPCNADQNFINKEKRDFKESTITKTYKEYKK